ncbi:MAG: hypothetical protein LBQ52_07075, partial [Helicobacteraceae bacterium]|nr:hypothetical protein [Helicobacteraceae bacterium]
ISVAIANRVASRLTASMRYAKLTNRLNQKLLKSFAISCKNDGERIQRQLYNRLLTIILIASPRKRESTKELRLL